jgi:uncharacterized protein (TIGR03437 family)
VLAVCFTLPAAAQFGNYGFSFSQAGPYGTPARLSTASVYQSSTNFLAASPEGGLWQSTNGGNSWQVLTDSAPTSQICSVTFNPATPTTLFAGTGDDLSLRGNPGVMRSTDGGQTWSLSAGFSSNAVCALALDPTNSQRVLAGSLSGIFLSVDQGNTWTQVSSAGAQTLQFDPAGNGVVYATVYSPSFLTGAGSASSPLLKSTDGGVTWNTLPITPPYPSFNGESRTFLRASMTLGAPGTLYLVVSYLESPTVAAGDVFVSSDGGNTWSVQQAVIAVSPNVAGTGRLPMYFDATRNYLYIGGAGLQRSTAAAQSFSAVSYPSIGNVQALSANLAATPPALLAAGDLGLVSIPLAGATATALNNPPVALLESSSVDPVTAQVTYTSGESGVAAYSPFFGVWNTPVTSPVGFTTAVNTSPENVYSMGSGNFFESTDAAAKFTSFTAIPSTEQHAPYPPLLVDTVSLSLLYTAGQKAYRSTNGGQSWSALSGQIDSSGGVVTAMAYSPLLRQIMYAATACLSTAVPAPQSCPATSRVYMSTNTGATWTLLGTVNGYVSRLAVDPTVSTAVYAVVGAFPGGPNPGAGLINGDVLVLRAAAGATAATQTSVKGNLPAVPINAILVQGSGGTGVVSTTLAQTYYVGTDSGVYYTTNGGATWINLSVGLPQVPVTDISLQGTTLHAATYGRGVYAASTSAISASTVVQPLSANVSVMQGQSASAPVIIGNVGTSGTSFQIQLNDSWLSVSPSTGLLGPGTSQNVLLTVNASSLAVGSYRTQFQVIQVANSANPYAFPQNITLTVQVTPPPAKLIAVSGGGASASAGSPVTLVAQTLNAAGQPVSGVAVQFQIVAGGGELSFSSVNTNAQGDASVTLTLPPQAGAVTVAASVGSLSVTYAVTALVLPAPTLNAGAVVNAATFVAGGPLAPGSIVSLFGSQLAPGVFSAAFLPLPVTLGGTQVLLGTTPIPLLYVSPAQINAILPFGAAIGPNQISVVYPGPNGAIASNAISVSIVTAAPGIFTNGTGAGIFVKANNTVVSAANPAARGSVVTFYAVGLGAVAPPVADGAAALPAPNLSFAMVQPAVNIGGVDATVQFAGLAPGFAGLYQINAYVPTGISPDSSTLVTLRVGLAVSNTVTIAVN